MFVFHLIYVCMYEVYLVCFICVLYLTTTEKPAVRYDEVSTFLLDAEELLGIYGLHVPDLGLPAAHDFDT